MAVGYLADVTVGDPRTGHPVALFGCAAEALERRIWADTRLRGVVYTGSCVAATVAIGLVAKSVARHPLAEATVTSMATWAVLGGKGLAIRGEEMAGLLEDAREHGDLRDARGQLSHLCGRDPDGLGESGLVRAATESIAENTSDAVVAPLLWGGLAGIPGMLCYRGLNTLDAMVGHRTRRYRRFGWASARLDDLANHVPARFSALATAACAPLVRGRPRQALRARARDAPGHPSPNAGQVEAAFAGALGVRLGGLNRYAGLTEDRGTLGEGAAPAPNDLRRAVLLSRAIGVLALGCSVLGATTLRARLIRKGGGR